MATTGLEHQVEETSTENQYTAKAGEFRVASELLFRHFNASIMSVDEGLDIVATKDDKLFNVQVKTSNINPRGYYQNDMRISSFVRHEKGNNFVIFMLKNGSESTFAILPYFKIREDIAKGNIKVIADGTRYRFRFMFRDEELFLGNLSNPVTHYKDNWDSIR